MAQLYNSGEIDVAPTGGTRVGTTGGVVPAGQNLFITGVMLTWSLGIPVGFPPVTAEFGIATAAAANAPPVGYSRITTLSINETLTGSQFIPFTKPIVVPGGSFPIIATFWGPASGGASSVTGNIHGYIE